MQHALTMLLTMLALAALQWAASREAAPRAGADGTLLLRHGAVMRWFARGAAYGIPIAITALVAASPPKTEGDELAVVLLYVGFLALSAPLLWDTARFQLTISPAGLDCRSPWRRGRFVPWSEVERLSYNPGAQWFVLRTRDGWKFRVPSLLTGVQAFLEACEAHLPSTALRGAASGYAGLGRRLPP